jgi:prophage regulatory protein
MAEQLLNRRDVLKATSLSGPTLWRRCRDGGFPKPIKISEKRVAWSQSDIDRWLANLRRTDGTPAIVGDEAIVPPVVLPPPDPGRLPRGRPKNPQAPAPLGGGASL